MEEYDANKEKETRQNLAFMLLEELDNDSSIYIKVEAIAKGAEEKMMRIMTKYKNIPPGILNNIQEAADKVPLSTVSYKHHLKTIFRVMLDNNTQSNKKQGVVITYVIFVMQLVKRVQREGDSNDIISILEFTSRIINEPVNTPRYVQWNGVIEPATKWGERWGVWGIQCIVKALNIYNKFS